MTLCRLNRLPEYNSIHLFHIDYMKQLNGYGDTCA
jgi:hypothetical protein